MIKCLCKENVQDRLTGENYIAGREYDFTEERAAEVTNSRYFEYAPYKAEVIEADEVGVKLTKPKRAKKSAKK